MSIYGRGGASASQGGAWAKNDKVAKIGAAGEKKVAKALEPYFSSPSSAALFHDLAVPGRRANIDHLIVSGRKVLLLDTKVWKAGFYFTFFSRTFRWGKGKNGPRFERLKHADKKTYQMLTYDLKKFLEPVGAKILTPAVIVLGKGGKAKVGLYRPKGAKAYNLDGFLAKKISRMNLTPPEPAIFSTINRLFDY